jgi:hypothetical protein
MHYVYALSQEYHTHFLFLQTVVINPVDSVSRWCNTNRKLSTILPLHGNTKTTRSVDCIAICDGMRLRLRTAAFVAYYTVSG